MIETILLRGGEPPAPTLTHAALIASCGFDGCPPCACPGHLRGLWDRLLPGEPAILNCGECGQAIVLDCSAATVMQINGADGRLRYMAPQQRKGA